MKVNSKYSEFQWRYITKEDCVGQLTQWWKSWGFPVPTLDMLPRDGIILSRDGEDLYAGFIYYTGTSLAWVEFVVSNKFAPIEARRGALDRFFDVISTLVKSKGVNKIFTSTNSEGFRNSLLKCNFKIGDTNTTQLIKKI